MEIKTIKYMLRKNLGNYEHAELSMEATVSEGESNETAILSLMNLTKAALNDELKVTEGLVEHKVQLSKEGEPNATATFLKPADAPAPSYPAAKEGEKKAAAPRTRKAKATEEKKADDVTEEGQAIPPVIPQEAAPSENTGGTSKVAGRVDTANVSHVQSEEPKAAAPVKGQVAYDSTIKEHRSRFATYLGQTYPKWKTAHPEDKIREFSKNLHGKAFEDSKGNMLESFKAELEAFFGHAK